MLHRVCASTSIALALFVAVEASAALPQRTFVASYGNDGWPCSLAQPCRGFQAAINAVAAGGEVVAIDSAGYGTMEIHKAVSVIVPPGVHAGLSPTTGIPLPGFAGQSTVVLIDIQNTDTVVLRGLNVNQQGTVTGGIHWLSELGGTVHVENTTVNGFLNAALFMSAPSGWMFVKDSIFRNNGYGIYQRGYLYSYLFADHVHIEKSTNAGILIDGAGHASISDSLISANFEGINVFCNSINQLKVYINRSVLSGNNVTFKMYSESAVKWSEIIVAASTIFQTNQTVQKSGFYDVLISHGNNSLPPPAIFDTTYPLQ